MWWMGGGCLMFREKEGERERGRGSIGEGGMLDLLQHGNIVDRGIVG